MFGCMSVDDIYKKFGEVDKNLNAFNERLNKMLNTIERNHDYWVSCKRFLSSAERVEKNSEHYKKIIINFDCIKEITTLLEYKGRLLEHYQLTIENDNYHLNTTIEKISGMCIALNTRIISLGKIIKEYEEKHHDETIHMNCILKCCSRMQNR